MSTSKIIVFGLEFQAALKAAMAVAANKEPFDVIQLRINPAGGDLMVCARDPQHDLIVSITVGTTMVDVVADRDEVIEISKPDARVLAAMKVKQFDEEEDPLVGLIIAEDRITRTDETGFGLGIRQARVRRATWAGEPPALGDVEGMLARAADSLPGESGALTPTQWKKLAAVATATEVSLLTYPLEASDGDSRVLITGDRVAAYASSAASTPRTEEPSPTTPALDDVTDLSTRRVSARPPKGIA